MYVQVPRARWAVSPLTVRPTTTANAQGDSPAQWMSYLNEFLAATPRDKAGVGLGAWADGKSDWWETADGAAFKVNASIAANVPELAVFRILPSTSPPWPLPFWWPALERF